MLVKLKRRLHRVEDTLRGSFRRNKPKKLDFHEFHAEFHEFHVDWDGLRSFTEVLNKNLLTFGHLKSAIDELWRYIEMFESNQHKTKVQSREEYEKLGIEINDLFSALSKSLGGTSTASITHESLAQFSRDIENEINALGNEQLKITEQDVERRTDVRGILRCFRRLRAPLGRFALNENTGIWKIFDENLLATRLDSLSHSPAAQYRPRESGGCTPNTRINVLQQLRTWAYYDDDPRIFWLNGLAGTGKTTIAYSFCEQLESAGKLAASFFCSRQLPACRDVKRILPSISYQLSVISRPFRCALSSALEDPEVHNLPFSEQLVKLVAEPLLKVKHTFPADMVIVIDALDECEGDEDVNRILDILLRRAPDLPARFFITSRPSRTIRNLMRSKWGGRVLSELRLHEVDRSAVQEDIKTYLTARLKPANLFESEISSLVERSGLFFVFAATIVNYLGHDNFSQGTERLSHLLGAPPNKSHGIIDLLYSSTLQMVFDNSPLETPKRDEMVLVLHTVVCAQELLTVDLLASLLKLDSAVSVDNALLLLQPLLQVSDTSGLVTTLHVSLRDYLCDQQRSDRFYCDAGKHHARLAQSCFDLIAVPSPPFNICKLESSYLRDREAPNIDKRVKEAISLELLYACRHWGAHLEFAGDSKDLLNHLHGFLATRLLLWMEILNLSLCMSTATSQLARLRARLCTRLKEIGGAAVIQDLVHDAWRFVGEFSSSPMSHSTPHIYVSMLPFWPSLRPVSKHYMPHMRSLVEATGAGMRCREWEALVFSSTSGVLCLAHSPDDAYIVSGSWDNTIHIWDVHTRKPRGQPLMGHKESVWSVAYSPNGAYIVSGSRDKMLRIWDAHTGQAVGGPLLGHTLSVYSVAYSPNGAHIVSGSEDKTIRIWDARTGQPRSQPLKGHTDSVYSVSYSPNGAYIISGSADETIRIWDTHTGQAVAQPLKGHTGSIYSVACSPNGAYIVSGSYDKTIRIWNARTGQSEGQPLEGHTRSVLSVAYSPNGAYIVSGSLDETICIWDAHTRQLVSQPFEGHTNWVYSVSYSPNGAYIVSGSWDKTIRIWDAHTRQPVGQPPKGHTGPVSLVAYSPNGAHIVSGSSDKTIRIWDARTGQPGGQPLKGHTRSVNSVAYSPGGEYIASGSSDSTVRIWDARTGQPIGQPLGGHEGSVHSVAYSPNGAYIVSGSEDQTIRIWDAHTRQPVGRPLWGHAYPVYSVACSPNGAYIISGSGGKTLRIWDAHTGQSAGRPLEGHTGSVQSVVYSPNGAYIVSGSSDKTVRIWDAHTGQPVGWPLTGHTHWVCSVACSPNGAYIVSGSADKTIRIWDAHTRQCVARPFNGHVLPVYSVAYSPDGGYIVSGSEDQGIRIWHTHTRLSPPSGAYVVSGSAAKPLRVRDTHRREILGPPAEVSSVHPALSPGLSYPAQSVPPISETVTTRITEPQPDGVSVPSDRWTLDRQGWVINAERDPLVWVPRDLRKALVRPQNAAAISCYGPVRLDFRNAKLGEDWAQCFDPQPALDVN